MKESDFLELFDSINGKRKRRKFLDKDKVTYLPVDGDNVVGKVSFEENYEVIDGDSVINMDPMFPMGRVYINDKQYFQMIPRAVWDLCVEGVHPARKWLRDRQGERLKSVDIRSYHKMVGELFEEIRAK